MSRSHPGGQARGLAQDRAFRFWEDFVIGSNGLPIARNGLPRKIGTFLSLFRHRIQGNELLAGGEAGSETVVGTQSLMEMIRNAVASMAGGTTINYGGVNINVYAKENQDIRALADEIEYRINNNVMRRKAAMGT